ncbi:uncharacterized protein EV420DRAFT_1522263 [Desarmillaria tabescens]|uniref:Integrase zinc-binding domain-containing protein n=1 Tax=Armillaria tabescens TaxID=1929756 RepID=A0AA39NCD7_ARMTA|nr:uncharacterized protein EV420DRAFT_1522263 [Desarmillaria tabescens]KAK0463014.1 hypothetical protein EV420DRAFT_1522263 [Desarmillaria tabescens]
MPSIEIYPCPTLPESQQHELVARPASPTSALSGTVSFPDCRDFEIFLDNYANALSADARPGIQLMQDKSYDALVTRLRNNARGNFYSRASLADKFFSLTAENPPRLIYKDQIVIRRSQIFSVLQEHHCPNSSRRMYASLRKTYCFIPRQVVNEYVRYCSLEGTKTFRRRSLRSSSFLCDNDIASLSTCPHPSLPSQSIALVPTAAQSEVEYRSTAPTPSPARLSQGFNLPTPGITLPSPSVAFSSIVRSRRRYLTPSPRRQDKVSSITEPQNSCSRGAYSYGIVRGTELFIHETLSDCEAKDDALPIFPPTVSCNTTSTSSSLSPAPKTPQPELFSDDIPSPAFSDLSFIFASPRSPLASKTLPVPYSNEHDRDDSDSDLELGAPLDVYGV